MPENDIFYFHPDHLGSTSYITNKNGSISQHVEYIAFGEVLFEEHTSSFSSPYLFNGKELDRDTNLSYFGMRYYDAKTSLWLSLDPLAEKGPNLGGYIYCFNNPMMFKDPNGLWPIYSAEGEYLGDDGRKAKGKDLAFTGEKDGKGGFKNLEQFTDNHSQFLKKSGTVYGESSAYKSSMTEDLKKEMFAIASVHQRNSTAYGATSDQAKRFKSTSKEDRNGTKMQYAVAAEINALTGGFDYSYGADAWDGGEQAEFKSTDYRFSNGRFELHKNTLGWTISDDHYKEWSSNIGEKFEVPQISFTPYSDIKFNRYYQAGRINLKSTAVYNKTIFWKILKGNDVIKAYPWSIPNRPVEAGFLDNFKQ